MAEDYESVGKLLEPAQKLGREAIKLWLSRLRGSSANVWTRVAARWVRRASVPLPLSIQVVSTSGTCRTVGLSEMHDAAFQFYQDLYNAGDTFTLPSRAAVGADVFPADFSFDSFHATLGRVLLRTSPHRAPGLDGTYVLDYTLMPPEGLRLFTRLCLSILETGVYPPSWFDVKVVLIPKKSGFLSFKDLRPSAVAPVPYRLFGKALLCLSGHAMTKLHAHSVGGVPGRSAQQAFVKVCFIIEKVRSAKGSFSGLAIDTQNFFDCIPHALAYRSLLLIGVSPLVVHTWLTFVLSIRRFVSLKGSVSPVPIFSDRGIPQGDPISMLAAAVSLAVWLTDLEAIPPSPSATAWVSVDDRLLGLISSLLPLMLLLSIWVLLSLFLMVPGMASLLLFYMTAILYWIASYPLGNLCPRRCADMWWMPLSPLNSAIIL